MRGRNAFLAGAGALVALIAILASNAPVTINSGDHSRVGAPGWAFKQTLTLATTTYCIKRDPGANACALFGLGSTTHVTLDNNGTCCFASRAAPALGDQTTDSAPIMTVGTSSGSCAGDVFGPDTKQRDMMPVYETIRDSDAPHGLGLCSRAVNSPSSPGGIQALCSVDADCVEHGFASGSTCVTTYSKDQVKELGGVTMWCRSDTAGAIARGVLER